MSVDYYSYNAFNQISNVTENKVSSAQPWEQYVFKQEYSYDQWGNRTLSYSDVPGAFNLPFNIDAATNRLLAPNGCISYDADGNQTNDCYSGGGARTYDAENRMLTAQGHSYVYEADGRRTRRAISGGQTWWQVYGLAGEMVAEYVAGAAPTSPTKEYGYRGGQLLVVNDGGRMKWLVGDHLGTPRMVIDQSGDLTGTNQVIRHDYLPFGEEILAGTGIQTTSNGYAGDGIRQKFTGKDRDSETGLDYFEARYYAGKQGRFTSPDEFTGGPDELFDFVDVASENPTLYGDIAEPQSLNKYVYCYNNPLSNVDPDGHSVWTKIAKLAWKTYKKGDAVAAAIETAEDAITVFDSSKSKSERIWAAVSVISEISPLSISDARDIYRWARPAAKKLDNAADATKATARGVEAEKRVLADIGETKNTKKVSSAEGNAIPDFQNKTTIGEIKDTKKVSNTRQIRIERDAAKASGRKHVIYTGKNTKVSRKVLEKSEVRRRDDLGPPDE